MLDLLGSMDHTSRIEPSIRRAQQCHDRSLLDNGCECCRRDDIDEPGLPGDTDIMVQGIARTHRQSELANLLAPDKVRRRGKHPAGERWVHRRHPGILTAADFGLIRGLRSRQPENAIEETLNQLDRQFCCGVAGKHPLGEPGDSRQNELGVEVGIH